jgi:hypothetical protein
MIAEYRLIRKKDGKIIEDSGWKPSRSYVLNFLRWLFQVNRAASDVSVTDTGGAARTIGYSLPYWEDIGVVMAGAGVDTFGIQVGTGTATPTNTDYALQSKIPNGTGAGQLQYGSQQETDPAITAEGNVDFLLTRDFTNASGGSITVNEIGVVIRVRDSGGTWRYFLILRDLATKEVLNGETLTVQYKLRTHV